MTENIKKLKNIVIYLILIAVVLIINLPTISMLGTSFKSESEVLSTVSLFPKNIYLGNFKLVLLRAMFGSNMINSLYYSCFVTLLCIIIACLAGYAISRYDGLAFKGFSVLLLFILMFPLVLILLPLFMALQSLNLVNTRTSIIVSYLAFQLPFCIWMVKGFFDSIPYELEEAAIIDGCTQVQSLIKIIFPLSLPGVATVAIFSFIRCWNEFMLASVFIKSDSLASISIGLRHFQQEFNVDWGGLSAASVLASIPTILFIMVAQKYLIQGMTSGSVKG